MATGRDIKDVLRDGYFKTHRTWDVLKEIKAADRYEDGVLEMVSVLSEEGRKEIFENLLRRQPRRHPMVSPDDLPPEVMERMRAFEKAWNNGRRK